MIFKCKMCGAVLEIAENQTIATCDYCDTQQTLPKLEDEKRANLYDRANHFRRNDEFDKAMGMYERILNEDITDAEAYWSLVLCRYGIKYVEDPTSHKRIPTMNRTQYTSIFDDDNYKSALKHADANQRIIYEQEANTINEIQKGILEISQKEKPFDVFICYKETDEAGRRTPDSVLANDLYHLLQKEGFKVFFARITLEDKIGSAYEPYIFAALNSAKVMVVLGTKQEYFNAVWVKNEWSRYLALVKQSEGQRALIPAYKDMDPYDLPEEFSHLQAQDMSKLGFMQDLIHGIKKLAQNEPRKTEFSDTVVVHDGGNTAIEPLLKRAFIYLEDGEWENADQYCERVLDLDPENANAYLGKLMVEFRIRKRSALKDCSESFNFSNHYIKIMRFADEELRKELEEDIRYIEERNEKERLENIYASANDLMNSASLEKDYLEAAIRYESILDYQDSKEKAYECRQQAVVCHGKEQEEKRLNDIYKETKKKLENAQTIQDCDDAYKLFESIISGKELTELMKQCELVKTIILRRKECQEKSEEIQNQIKEIRREYEAHLCSYIQNASRKNAGITLMAMGGVINCMLLLTVGGIMSFVVPLMTVIPGVLWIRQWHRYLDVEKELIASQTSLSQQLERVNHDLAKLQIHIL